MSEIGRYYDPELETMFKKRKVSYHVPTNKAFEMLEKGVHLQIELDFKPNKILEQFGNALVEE